MPNNVSAADAKNRVIAAASTDVADAIRYKEEYDAANAANDDYAEETVLRKLTLPLLIDKAMTDYEFEDNDPIIKKAKRPTEAIKEELITAMMEWGSFGGGYKRRKRTRRKSTRRKSTRRKSTRRKSTRRKYTKKRKSTKRKRRRRR